MKDPLDRLRSLIADAERAALGMSSSPRCEVATAHLAAARAEADRPLPSVEVIAKALQQAVVPALIEATEVGELGDVQAALGRAWEAALDAAARDRLAEAPPLAAADGLTAITVSFPTMVPFQSQVFARPWSPQADEATEADEAEG